MATHHKSDLDAVASITLLKEDDSSKEIKLFLRNDDEILNEIPGLIIGDRGKGEFYHYRPTSTSLVAKELGIEDKREIRRLISKVQRSDLQGESLPFDVSDLIKCMQRTGITNERIVELGTKIVKACLYFSKKSLKRKNEKVKKIVEEFLKKKKIKPPKFRKYLVKLNNEKFERPFDLVETYQTLVHQEENKKEIKAFLEELLEIEYNDSLNYLKAVEETKKAWKAIVKGCVICTYFTNNPRFKDTARNLLKALIIIIRNTSGHTQIYFDTQRIKERTIEILISMIKLEKCLVQDRQIPKMDFRREN